MDKDRADSTDRPTADAQPRTEREERRSSSLPRLPSANAKLVYLYLEVVTEAHVTEIKRTLDLDLLTLFPVLETLRERELVERRGMRFRCRS